MLRSLSNQISKHQRNVLRLNSKNGNLFVKNSTISIRNFGQDSFLQGENASYVDEMYEAWLKDPNSVHISWNAYFKNLNGNRPASSAYQAPPTIIPNPIGTLSLTPDSNTSIGGEDVMTHLKTQLLVRAYEVRGHLKAKIDPLHVKFCEAKNKPSPK